MALPGLNSGKYHTNLSATGVVDYKTLLIVSLESTYVYIHSLDGGKAKATMLNISRHHKPCSAHSLP
jgi:hypothetical protein